MKKEIPQCEIKNVWLSVLVDGKVIKRWQSDFSLSVRCIFQEQSLLGEGHTEHRLCNYPRTLNWMFLSIFCLGLLTHIDTRKRKETQTWKHMHTDILTYTVAMRDQQLIITILSGEYRSYCHESKRCGEQTSREIKYFEVTCSCFH